MKTESGESFFANSGASELWAEPAVVPSDLSMDPSVEISTDNVATAKSELWAEPAPVPSHLANESSVTFAAEAESIDGSRHDSPQPTTLHQRLQRSEGTPTHLLSHFESFSRSLDLSLSPIQKTQELAWAPE